ncbi:tetratricopeptide repeat protein [Streptomyces umbrinus]|uniref:tetratricopeptide repeat protein n=1 Tax=Streptomyces umbrinus TaxID=67370 RepID=UPI0033F9B8EB
MHDEQASQEAALAELRQVLDDGLARTGLTKTQVKARANLGRTTVHQAFQTGGPVPAAATVVALARVLRLPEQRLLDLRRAAVGDSRAASAGEQGPGKPIDEWDPHALEVHPAEPALGTDAGDASRRALPGYVARAHDAILAAAVQDAAEGHSRLVVLVGSSSTGKTRACWEAVQPLARQGWRLWHPFDPTRADAALEDLGRVRPSTVVWLNEAQHYLGDPGVGERVAAAVHSLLTSSERSPVLVVGTLWPEYANQYTALPSSNAPDRHSRVRELLAGRTIAVPDTFDQEALRRAAALAEGGDRLLGATLRRASTDRRVTQDLAGAPELLRRYEQGTPAARAVLEAAMDARRLGVGLHLPQAFLTDATLDYLSEHDGDRLAEDWAERALAELALPVHGHQAPLRLTRVRPPRPPAPPHQHSPAGGPVVRLADYLEQHGRSVRRALCPPASFWHAAYDHLTDPAALSALSGAAELRYRLQWAHCLRLQAGDAGDQRTLAALAHARAAAGDRHAAEAHLRRAADMGSIDALTELARMREQAGNREEAATLYRQVADALEPRRLYFGAREEEPYSTIGAEILYRRAVDMGELIALRALARLRERAGDRDGAETVYRQGAEANDADSVISLAWMRARAGDQDGAEDLYRRALGIAGVRALVSLARAREVSGDTEQAQAVYARAASADSAEALVALARMRAETGDRDGAEHLYRRAADRGDARAWLALARIRGQAGNVAAAEHCCRRATDAATAAGDHVALMDLAQIREEAGDRDSARTLIRQAADAAMATGVTGVLMDWVRRCVAAGDFESAEALASRAADAGSADALGTLVQLREVRGDRRGSQDLANRAADTGNTRGLNVLARMREQAGDRESAAILARRAADAGDSAPLMILAKMRDEAGNHGSAQELALQAAERGNIEAVVEVVKTREQAGDHEGAETLARQATALSKFPHAGEARPLVALVQIREKAGNHESAETLARQAADTGGAWQFGFEGRWPNGLDPDGCPTPHWNSE